MYKLGWFPDGVHEERHLYGNTWTQESTSGPNRLVIAAAENQVELLRALSTSMTQPFHLLYVLVVQRGGSEAARYQSAEPVSSAELGVFLRIYGDFFETDARANLWIISSVDSSLLIYDRHNVVYAYGPLESFISTLNELGFHQAPDVSFPDPHSHLYHSEFDEAAEQIIRDYEWIASQLRAGDENP